MIMSEGNKLPALSLEVKKMIPRWNGVASHLERHVFSSGREEARSKYLRRKGKLLFIIVYWVNGKRKWVDWYVWKLNKQRRAFSFAFGYTFEVKIYSKQNTAYENESYRLVCRCFNVILHDTSWPGILWA